jgi:hypothetical protein
VLINGVQMSNNLLKMSDHNQPHPILAVHDLLQNQSCHHQSQIFWRFRYRHCFPASLQMTNLDILLCVWIWRWSLLYLLNKSNIWMSGLLVPPNHGNGGQHLVWIIYPSWGKPHMHFITNMRDPTFILVTHFSPKIILITFLNKQGKFNLEGHFTTHKTDGLRMILTLSWHDTNTIN